jgi:hypothetical protein
VILNGSFPVSSFRVRVYVGYNFMVGRKVVCTGITHDIDGQEIEHRRTWPGGHLHVLTRTMTEEDARDWDSEHGRRELAG